MSIRFESLNLLEMIIESYDTNLINTAPDNAKTLYYYYQSFTEKLLKYFKDEVGDLPYVISNEIRAMFGHLTKHSLKQDLGNIELNKAYGHFRRLNLDIFKILCDEFDKSFSYFINKSHKYNYKKISNDFLLNYSNKYIDAQSAFLDAQFSESIGRNDDKNVYEKYFEAFRKYVFLNKYHYDHIKQINKIRRRTRWLRFASAVVSTIMILLSALTLIPLPPI